MSLFDVFNEIKFMMINKEEIDSMDKGAYKNARTSEFVTSPMVHDIKVVKAPTLTQLLTVKPTEDDYERILEKLIKLFKLTYNEYKFYVAKSSDETQAPNFLQVTSPAIEYPELHRDIFKMAVNTGMDMLTLQKKFAEKVAEGKVADLGNGVVVILNDNTPQLPTAVSPIQSGLEGSEISFIISFMKAENFDSWYANTFPEVANDGE